MKGKSDPDEAKEPGSCSYSPKDNGRQSSILISLANLYNKADSDPDEKAPSASEIEQATDVMNGLQGNLLSSSGRGGMPIE
ncbi:hypothetical protein F2Q69_00038496 [Brassica cretica]|uniref:Uncharacterized protein n=1 Tax=Brassica cretica TaxID=69181 RepID=A0A8S9SVQ4_BRACR|nr:hypothetical protein F2Q69_00038496 [Brassica cretica]